MTKGGRDSKCFLVYRDYILKKPFIFPLYIWRSGSGGRGNLSVEDRAEPKGADTGSVFGDAK